MSDVLCDTVFSAVIRKIVKMMKRAGSERVNEMVTTSGYNKCACIHTLSLSLPPSPLSLLNN